MRSCSCRAHPPVHTLSIAFRRKSWTWLHSIVVPRLEPRRHVCRAWASTRRRARSSCKQSARALGHGRSTSRSFKQPTHGLKRMHLTVAFVLQDIDGILHASICSRRSRQCARPTRIKALNLLPGLCMCHLLTHSVSLGVPGCDWVHCSGSRSVCRSTCCFCGLASEIT